MKIYLNKKKCWQKEVWNPGNFACGILNAEPWNPESIDDWYPKSNIYWYQRWQSTRNPLPGIRNKWRRIQNPRLSWIPYMVRQEKSSTPTGFVWNTNIAAAPLLAFGKLIWPPFHFFGRPIWPPFHYFGTPKWQRLHQCGILIWPQFHVFGKPIWPPFHCFGTPIWPPFHCFRTLIWPPRYRVKNSIGYANLHPLHLTNNLVCRKEYPRSI